MSNENRQLEDRQATMDQTPLIEPTPPIDQARVAQRAYEKFLQRGGAEGSDVEDWLAAEAELRGSVGISNRTAAEGELDQSGLPPRGTGRRTDW